MSEPTALPKISKPGAYDGLAIDFYHGDCCDGPALSSSGARTIVDECPAIFKHERDNPRNNRAFDIGTAAHLLTLEPEQWEFEVVIVEGRTKDGKPSKGYASQEAKDLREAAYRAGKTPLLPEEADGIIAMKAKLFAHPIAAKAFRGGHAERSYFSRDPFTGIWLKSRPDYSAGDLSYLLEYKSTSDVNPRQFSRRAFDLGYYMQAAWSLDGVAAATGIRPREYYVIAQASKPPYLVTVFRMSLRAIEWGAIMNRRAIDIYAGCLDRGEWPGYRDPRTPWKDSALEIDLPGYAEFQLQARHEAGEFERIKPSADMLKRAADWQAPLFEKVAE
jgi:hypothetical protein